MKPAALLLLVLPLFGFSQYTYQQLRVNFLEKDSVSKSYTYENLRLYPVYAKESFKSLFKGVGNYLPLQEAISKKKVRITEKSASGSVNNLTIENISKDTIIIICGDVVKGGKQDRIVEQDVVLQPASGKKDLKVFCVESGRWSAPDRSTARVRSSALQQPPPPGTPQFNGHFNKGAMSLRKVVEKEKQQDKVWQKVEEINARNITQTETKTYTAISQSASYSKKLAAYVQFFQTKITAEPDVVGVVVVTGNKVLGCDLFATPALFKSQFPSLLHSYATEAIVNGSKVTASTAVVKTYTDKLLRDEAVQAVTLKEKGTAFVEKGKKLRVSSFD